VKKNNTKDQERGRNSRRLSLNRETIRLLDDPALLELARGGGPTPTVSDTVESTSQNTVMCF
jgi:hypothetical protein